MTASVMIDPARAAVRITIETVLAAGLALTLVGCASAPSQTPTPTPVASETPSPASAGPSASAAVISAAPTIAASPTDTRGGTRPPSPALSPSLTLEEFRVRSGSGPHDVSMAADGGVWYSGQRNGTLGYLDPATGDVREIDLGSGSSPHGVITGPDDAAWLTDGGLNAIVRVDPQTELVQVFPLPQETPNANLNTAVFDPDGVLWFTGQNGFFGRFDPSVGEVEAWPSPRGPGPYGITATPSGEVWYASLAGSHIARIDPDGASAAVVEPPTPGQGARRVWSDSQGRIWVSEYNAGQVARYDPADGSWMEWPLPGDSPAAYSVYVDEGDIVWLTDFAANSIVRFDPASETFISLPLPGADAAVRQMLGRPGEAWGAESSLDRLVVVRTER